MKVWFRKHRHGIQKAVFITGIIISGAVTVLGFIDASINRRVMVNYTIDTVHCAVVLLWCASIFGYMLIRRYNKTCDAHKIYTHNVAADILDLLEDVLDKHDITIPDKYREGDESEARIYGEVYSELLEDVENAIIDVLGKHNRGSIVITDEFE